MSEETDLEPDDGVTVRRVKALPYDEIFKVDIHGWKDLPAELDVLKALAEGVRDASTRLNENCQPTLMEAKTNVKDGCLSVVYRLAARDRRAAAMVRGAVLDAFEEKCGLSKSKAQERVVKESKSMTWREIYEARVSL